MVSSEVCRDVERAVVLSLAYRAVGLPLDLDRPRSYPVRAYWVMPRIASVLLCAVLRGMGEFLFYGCGFVCFRVFHPSFKATKEAFSFVTSVFPCLTFLHAFDKALHSLLLG